MTDQTFTDLDKIKSSAEISAIFKKSDGFLRSSMFTVRWNSSARPRLAVCLAKVKRAVDRNALKRCAREAWRTLDKRPPADVVITINSAAIGQTKELSKQIKIFMHKIK